jgi:glycosyltransferase involved in cell wall biosynthesis
MEETSQPLVSIGMPVRNNETTLSLAIRSLLEQTYTNWELLLIDDGSSDGTLRVMRGFTDERIRILSDDPLLGRRARDRGRRLPDRLNQTIDASRGEYFSRMDGDDVSYPRRLERQVDYLRHHPEVDLVGAWVMVFGRGGAALGKRAGAEDHDALCARLWSGLYISHPTFLGRIEFFRRYRYRTSIWSEDQDLLLRASCDSRFANVPEILLGYREAKLKFKSMLISRQYFMMSLFREFRRQGLPLVALRAVIEQVLKALVDAVAIGSGLKYRLLPHRARPATSAELEQWERVWVELNRADEVQSHGPQHFSGQITGSRWVQQSAESPTKSRAEPNPRH